MYVRVGLFLALCLFIVNATCDSKIVGGFYMSPLKAPFIVSLQTIAGDHFCGGSLLTLSTVLTACHCVTTIKKGMSNKMLVTRPPESIKARVGSSNIKEDTSNTQTQVAIRVLIHPKCEFIEFITYDFSLVLLPALFKSSAVVNPFYLAGISKKDVEAAMTVDFLKPDRECTVAGWGSTTNDNKLPSPELKGVHMKVIDDYNCTNLLKQQNMGYFNSLFSENGQMCALPLKPITNESDCIGDSGGPFFCGNSVYGVISYGYDCGFYLVPSVYSKVSDFAEWYKSILHTTLLNPRTHSGKEFIYFYWPIFLLTLAILKTAY